MSKSICKKCHAGTYDYINYTDKLTKPYYKCRVCGNIKSPEEYESD